MSSALQIPGIRSYLFVPGNRPERFPKARAAGADAVVVDLEDAVQPAQKAAARQHVRDWLADAPGGAPVYVRINGPQTEWFGDDLAGVAALPGVAGLMLPKAEGAEPIARAVAAGHAGLRILPLIETARGFHHLAQVCAAPGVERLAFGKLDLQVELGLGGDGEELNLFRSQLVLASRIANLRPPVDGVTTTLDDDALTEADTTRARRFGFRGKLCIHPRQIPAIHRAFAYSPAEKAWAQRVLDAVATSGGAAVAVDGRMVDLPVILQAREIAEGASRL